MRRGNSENNPQRHRLRISVYCECKCARRRSGGSAAVVFSAEVPRNPGNLILYWGNAPIVFARFRCNYTRFVQPTALVTVWETRWQSIYCTLWARTTDTDEGFYCLRGYYTFLLNAFVNVVTRRFGTLSPATTWNEETGSCRAARRRRWLSTMLGREKYRSIKRPKRHQIE